MPYYTDLRSLPKSLRTSLPHEALLIYMAAFNHIWEEYREEDKRWFDISREDTARRIAWAAVMRVFYYDYQASTWRRRVSEPRSGIRERERQP
jgi:cation transport regulator